GPGLLADTFALSETFQPGCGGSAWACGGWSSGVCSIALGVGEEATCTITNTAQTAHLKLVKVVVNDNNGPAVATDFHLTASGPRSEERRVGKERRANSWRHPHDDNTTSTGHNHGPWTHID